MAKYRGIFARFSPAWHFPGVKSKTPEKKRKRLSGVQDETIGDLRLAAKLEYEKICWRLSPSHGCLKQDQVSILDYSMGNIQVFFFSTFSSISFVSFAD